MSQTKLVGDSAVMHCEVMGNPIPELQWWFIEGDELNETASQLFEGAQYDRVHINTTYIQHSASTLLLYNLTSSDTGVYECRASNDPDRNSLRTLPKVKWIRSQANVIVFESEWGGVEEQPTIRGCEPLRFQFLPLYCSSCVFPSTTDQPTNITVPELANQCSFRTTVAPGSVLRFPFCVCLVLVMWMVFRAP